MIKNKKNYVVLAKVTPWGRAEESLMNKIKDIHERFPLERHSVLMYEIFGFMSNNGEPYTMYVFEDEDLEELNKMQTYISDLLYEASIELSFPEEEMLPVVMFGEPKE